MKKYIGPILSISTIGLLFYTLFDLKEQVKELPRLKEEVNTLIHRADSLHNENYPCQIELNRYKIAYEIFLERNPKAAQEYGTIISEETE